VKHYGQGEVDRETHYSGKQDGLGEVHMSCPAGEAINEYGVKSND
jgi:hypothetical protein